MKTILIACLLLGAGAGFAQPPPPTVAQPGDVRISTEVEELARGYAAAFPRIQHTPVYLIHARGDTFTVLVSIKSVKAAAGVLIVQDEKGLTYVLNPKDVVMITDAPPKKLP